MQTVDKTLERTFISEVKDSQDETILLRGWVYKIIDLSNIVFLKPLYFYSCLFQMEVYHNMFFLVF